MCQVKRGGIFPIILVVFFNVINDNNIFELQGLLEHNDFANKPSTKITHVVIEIFNFLGQMFKFKHTLFHSYLFFPNFLS
jgi:hypothetical protein